MKTLISGLDIDNMNTALTKAPQDISDILVSSSCEYSNCFLTSKKKNKYFKYLDIIIQIKKQFALASKGIVVYQYPTFGLKNDRFIIKQFSKKSLKIVILHDLFSVRYSRFKNQKREIDFLNNFNYIISHNPYMSKWLKDNGVTSKIIDLELFDYLADIDNLATRKTNNFQIAFPGNLSEEKSGFVYKLQKINFSKVHFNLYGPNFSGESLENVQYKGIVHPDELIKAFRESFGLVWDGPEFNDCTGDFGEYQRYNNPHKASLYVAAGLPIIISNKAALADFVREHNIGITIDSLEELETIIPNISDETYRTYTENLKDLQQKVTTGYFITAAINKIEDMIENESH